MTVFFNWNEFFELVFQKNYTLKPTIIMKLIKTNQLEPMYPSSFSSVLDKFFNDSFGAIEKPSQKLQSFYNYDFKTFVAELKKKKVKLSLMQQDEWEEYFTSYKNKINALQTEIATTDTAIDKMVYQLYGLTEEEIQIVEAATK